jgi:ribokinase
MTRVAVVGHVEWIEFVRVDMVPAAGDIAHGTDAWEEAAGGGAVAAVQLARLAGEASFFTVVGDDEVGRRAIARLEALGVRARCARRPARTRRGITFVDGAGERTITTIGARLAPSGEDPLPWAELKETDAVYLTAADVSATWAARQARLLVAASRDRPGLAAARVPVDVLVGSARDPAERYEAGSLEPAPGLVVQTEGAQGGWWGRSDGTSGRWAPTELPGPKVDTYGAGDTFAAGLTFALGRGDPLDEALTFAARCGAACLTGRGPYGAPLPRA